MSEESGAVATQVQEYKSPRLEVVVLTHPECLIEFRIKATQELIKQAHTLATKEVGKEVMLPGFRKGKSPDEMVVKRYPKEIEGRTPQKLADLAFAEASQMAKIPLLNNNAKVTYDLKHFSTEKAEFTFSFETEPKVPQIDPTLFERKEVPRAEVGDKQIDEAIRQSQFFFAEWRPIDRPIQEKDMVIIDLDTVDGETVTRVFTEIRFEVSKERMADWMHQLVIGAKVGDQLEGESKPDEDATEEEKAQFTPKKVIIKIHKVEEAHLPEIDDAFAKKLGANDVAHMRMLISNMLNGQADAGVRAELRNQVAQFFSEKYLFDLPRSLVQIESDHRKQEMMSNSSFKRNFGKMTPEEKTAFEEKLKKESADSVRLFYLSRHLIQQEK
ncbi:MAG TPA: trigger factor, partial [Chlamydiales bacterium]|nr:trigger factor [Chlamydiales bacterium]